MNFLQEVLNWRNVKYGKCDHPLLTFLLYFGTQKNKEKPLKKPSYSALPVFLSENQAWNHNFL